MQRIYLVVILMVVSFIGLDAQATSGKEFEGRWDLEVEFNGNILPSWLEISHSGHNTLVGRFVYAFGSARPVSEIVLTGEGFTFTIPKQWETGANDMTFMGKKTTTGLSGTMIFTDGKSYNWSAVPSPSFYYNSSPVYGTPIHLFNGRNTEGWKENPSSKWIVQDGILVNPESGTNLISDQEFTDFNLKATFRYPQGSNSGIYLRGRYEVQIADNIGMQPSSILFGGIYGFLCPNQMTALPAGEWQNYDITLIGNRVTIIANGKTIIHDAIIPGITGGAIDSKEQNPGPFMIQGDHGPIEFKRFIVTPIF